jgi:hypothetical protein
MASMDVIILAVAEDQFAQISGVTWFKSEFRYDNISDAAAGGGKQVKLIRRGREI